MAVVQNRSGGSQPGMYAIEAYGMRKVYRSRRGRKVALAGLDLRVPTGGVHGFLGPNGAGKTTTIRMLLGLVRGDEGDIHVLGHEVPRDLPEIAHRIGAIVEQPRFFPAFSGYKNVELLAQGLGVPYPRIDEVLAEVGLTSRARDRFGTYSLGMKQRLALAGSLLTDPELLIFDEPTNGLDPAGIREIRAIMRNLSDAGKTVLVSSHILTEVEKIADTVSIIGRGRLLLEGRVDEIVSSGGSALHVGVDDAARGTQVLVGHGFVVSPGPGRLLVVSSPKDPGLLDPATILGVLAAQGLKVHELTPVSADLESIFLDLTADEHLGAVTDAVFAGPGGSGSHTSDRSAR